MGVKLRQRPKQSKAHGAKIHPAIYWFGPPCGQGFPVPKVVPIGWRPSQEGSQTENEKTMPKLKTHTGAAKRFSKTGSGKIKRHQTKMRHILTSKLPKTKRKLGKSLIVSDADHDKVARMIPYA
jgi:large subunit ribosomal protein L35